MNKAVLLTVVAVSLLAALFFACNDPVSEPITYTVRYDKNADDATGAMADSTHTYGVSKTLNACGFSRNGYVFAGWTTNADGSGTNFTNGQSVVNLSSTAGDVVTLYARWSDGNSYIVRYQKNAQDATGIMPDSAYSFFEGKPLAFNDYSRTGYTFTHWNTKANGSGDNFTNGQNVMNLSSTAGAIVTLYAQWTVNTYTVRYDKNAMDAYGYTMDSAHTYGVSKTLNANGFSRPDCTFAGWTANADGSGASYTDGQSVVNLSLTAGGVVTLYAKWTNPSGYMVRYDKNVEGATGTMYNSSHTTNVLKALTSNGYSLTGYTFTNWTTNADGSGASFTNNQSVMNLSSTPGTTVTLYAQWTVNTYTIRYEKNATDATGTMADSSHTYGVTQTLSANAFSRTGYTFAGWASSPFGGVAYADNQSVLNLSSTAGAIVSLYAQWTVNTYTIRYEKNATDATGTMADSTHTYGTAKPLTSNGYSRAGYSFSGWAVNADGSGASYTNSQSVVNLSLTAGDVITLYAKWTGYTLTISYANGGGTGSAPTSPKSAVYGDNVTMPENTYIRTGYTFTGWAVSGAGSIAGTYAAEASIAVSNLSTTIANGNAGITLTATWTINTYIVTYDTDGGTPAPTSPATVNYGTVITQPAVMTKTGYTFDKWYTNPAKTISAAFPITVTADVSLYAKWIGYTLTINYANGGGTGAAPTSPKSAVYGNNVTMPENTYTRTGYTFTGWEVSGTGSIAGTYTAGESVAVSNLSTAIANGNVGITLTAKWTINTLIINYADGDGTGPAPSSPISASYGTNVTMPENTYTRTGYVFTGWEVSGMGSIAGTYAAGVSVAVADLSTAIANGNAGITLTAKWRIYQLGDIGPGGGKIFYYSVEGFTMTDNDQVCHFLEAAPNNMPSTLAWASSGYTSTNITGTETAIGTGRKNTALILATDANAPAAKACKEYSNNGMTDWFLPSKDELNQLYANRSYVGNMGGLLWSSSQYNYTYSDAWSQYFGNGVQDYGLKYSYIYVRAVRAF